MSNPRAYNDFIKYLQDNPDPFKIKENGLKEYSIEEVSKHNSKPSIWCIYNDYVYDITMYIDYHPGGDIILKGAGKDITLLFNMFHGYVDINKFLEPFKIGFIKKSNK